MAKDDLELFRLKTELDIEKSKSELEEFKSKLFEQIANATNEFGKLKTELVEQVANAKVDIGKHAIDEMSKAFGFFRISILVAIGLVLTLGGLSYISVDSTVRKIVDAKLNDWLSFEKKGAILKDSLEQVRMKTALDSLVIRLARNKADDRPNFQFEISELEKNRLIA
ncbi:hypothetical protein LPB67_07765 [Undibacterium sp. Jales W-56]|uniref:hypothetical protein n=1 Tax=Undibacterium sp. Jales W-56 TaxID=2897325 RepID=UPI0021D2FF96|nr:hypothetical protein [Undibacterium sp. Jales W-56]MCU6433674.1 hypothetical protein [Undibacterium sp. Jales W-56]